ncbi:VOC family protein [Pendulispora brunnea]|uniref:VOC family protein n=1 Tax=Pendulispora brunnea TaxID=2905690 RepID=A0ABZ2KDY5_9BACT
MIATTHLRGVLLEAPDLTTAKVFYEDAWGLESLRSKEAAALYFRGRGDEPWIFGLTSGPRRRLRRLRLGLATREHVDLAYAELQHAGVTVVSPPVMLPGPGEYYGLLFKDPDGQLVELSATQKTAGPGWIAKYLPERMSHVVLNSPNARDTARFYVDILGFAVSDWYERDAIIFLRCNQDHHCIGLSQCEQASLNHVAFLVDDQGAVLHAGARAGKRGAKSIWGPGRHGPGGNVFDYFEDPSGFVVEYTAELIQIPPDTPWSAREWERTSANANVWGTGGPTPRALELMAGPR